MDKSCKGCGGSMMGRHTNAQYCAEKCKRTEVRGVTTDCKCDNCGDTFTARVADRNRGWARFCSKRCKAIKQEKRTGQYAGFLARGGI